MLKLYDYTCQDCGEKYEGWLDTSTMLMPPCTKCRSPNVKQHIPTPSFGGETPYGTLDKYGIPDKPIVSGKYYRSK